MPVPFALGFQIYPWVERLLRVRGHPLAAYGFALVIVAVAVLARWSIGEDVGGRIPFSIFYPAIILATVIGGLWPGILAAVLSFIAAWFFLSPVPPENYIRA
jgi:two-component system, sensor histidine kinase PdtaS